MTTIDIWEKQLNRYTIEQLHMKPAKDRWSLGQVYIHLIENTMGYNFKQIEICISSDQHKDEKKHPRWEKYFSENRFPAARIKTDPAGIGEPPQPKSIQQVKQRLVRVKKSMIEYEKKISQSKFNGKVKHPGLLYLDAAEWFQFVELHFRHHLKQKKRIDEYLRMKIVRKGAY